MPNKNPPIKFVEKPNELIDTKRINSLYNSVAAHIDRARHGIQRTIDIEMVKAYWLIGQDIVEEEQLGHKRADYGKTILKKLSEKLLKKIWTGF